MVKILTGLVVVLAIAVGGFFGFEFYVQQRVATDVEAAFAQVRASGGKATHGKVSFDLLSRTVAIADIAGESGAKPPVSVKIGRFTASGVSQPDASRFAADTIDVENVEASGSMAGPATWQATYKVPRLRIVNYSGPAGPMRPVDPNSPTDIYRFVLEHFSAVTATTITAPTITTVANMGGNAGATMAGTGDYTYSDVVFRDIKDGKIATMSTGKANIAMNVNAGGKTEKVTGEMNGFTSTDIDLAATAVILDPARANDDKYYRVYGHASAGSYALTTTSGMRARIEGIEIDDIGVRPSRLQLPALLAVIQRMPPPGTQPTPEQTRELLEKMASLYEGIRIGKLEIKGVTVESPQGPVKLSNTRMNLENGKIGEFAIEGFDAVSPKGPVKVGRFALKSLDVTNLMHMASQFAAPGQKPSTQQLLALLTTLGGVEIKGVVAPYKDTTKPVTIDTLNFNWGQFVGPIPTRIQLTAKMAGPIDASDPDPLKMLAASGRDQAAINLDLGAAWTEGTRSLTIAPFTAEIGDVGTAAVRISLANVPREVFSINPLQAAIMAAQVEAGSVEIAVRDTGGVDLAIAQYARKQNVAPDEGKRMLIENIKNNGMQMATTNPDAMAIAGALTRFIESPRGTLTVKLTPRGKVPAMSLLEALKTSPLSALAKFQVDASTGR